MRAVLLAVLVLAGCEPRQPPSRGEVVAIAGSHQRIAGTAWGEPVDVLPPPQGTDPDGRRWWQLRYAPAIDGTARVLLVDDDSRWVRTPPPGWTLRLAADPLPPQVPVHRPDPGTWLLVLVPPQATDEAGRTALETEAVRLNTLAGAQGRLPLFAVRGDAGRAALVYGWTGTGGIARDERLAGWVRSAGGRDPVWLDLGSP
jgi:hypothetical protein